MSLRVEGDWTFGHGVQVIGDVEIGPEASVWMNAVVRGDVHWIRIGARTNVQDLVLIHCDGGFPNHIGADAPMQQRVLPQTLRLEAVSRSGQRVSE